MKNKYFTPFGRLIMGIIIAVIVIITMVLI